MMGSVCSCWERRGDNKQMARKEAVHRVAVVP
jgi:hypothetical protein